jgi:Arc/MetJ-type ribon-helix-helix transcriptional regulator
VLEPDFDTIEIEEAPDGILVIVHTRWWRPDNEIKKRTALVTLQLTSIYHLLGWRNAMAVIHSLREKAADSEKITINIGFVDLGHVDLLVKEGFYSNRTDFIRTAIRNQLASHAEAVKQSIVRQTLELGLRHYSREQLEAIKSAGERLRVNVLGLASIGSDVTPELARETIESINVLGALHASPEVKAALADRIR